MALHALFDVDTCSVSGQHELIVLTGDLGRLSTRRRLALYIGTCQALGLKPELKPLRYVRCLDGALRLTIGEGEAAQIRERVQPEVPLAFIRGGDRPRKDPRTPRSIRMALLEGAGRTAAIGGISYDIDLSTGALAAERVIVRGVAGSPRQRPAGRAGNRRAG